MYIVVNTRASKGKSPIKRPSVGCAASFKTDGVYMQLNEMQYAQSLFEHERFWARLYQSLVHLFRASEQQHIFIIAGGSRNEENLLPLGERVS